MALAAHNVMKAKGREGIVIAGVDAMPPAVNAVLDGTMVATVRNPSCRIHGWAVAAGVAAVAGRRERPAKAAFPTSSWPTVRSSPRKPLRAISGCRRIS
jgi:ABC-type sugar transport system substrate-binding protein